MSTPGVVRRPEAARLRTVTIAFAVAASTTVGVAGRVGAEASADPDMAADQAVCVPAPAGDPGDLALVNLTPVRATGPGWGWLTSTTQSDPSGISNVNYAPGTVDPNVAAAVVGPDGRVCFRNDGSTIDLIADLVVVIDAEAVGLDGDAVRLADTRIGLAGNALAPGERRCFPTGATPGDLAVVNLTPVAATAPGNGVLTSSDATTPPSSSNVNFTPWRIDPNLAVSEVGGDGRICFWNSPHATVHLVADLLATLRADAVTPTPAGQPVRVADTRAGPRLAPAERRCFPVAADPGDLAVVNLTPVAATAPGHGVLTSSDTVFTPDASNVNYAPGTVDPNVAVAAVGADGHICFHNSDRAAVHLVADLITTVRADAVAPSATSLPARLVDSRPWELTEYVASSGYQGTLGDVGCYDVGVCSVGAEHFIRFLTSFVTIDGRTWRQPGEVVTSDIDCPAIATCVLVGQFYSAVSFVATREAFVSNDGGQSWRFIPSPPTGSSQFDQSLYSSIECTSTTTCTATSYVGMTNPVETEVTFTSTDGWDTVEVSETVIS